MWPRIPGRYYSVLLLRWNVGWFNCDRDFVRRLGAKELHFYLQCCHGKFAFIANHKKKPELKWKLSFWQWIVLSLSACDRIQFSVCSFHPFVRCSSVHGWFWAHRSNAGTLYLPHGVGWTKNKNSRWQYDLFLLQWFSDVVCPYRLFWTWLEESANDCYSTSGVAVSFLEVSKLNLKLKLLQNERLSIRLSIPVWNSGYYTWRMQQLILYFSILWPNPSAFQVSHENSK